MCQKGLECMGCLRSACWSSRRGPEENEAGAAAGETLTASFGGFEFDLPGNGKLQKILIRGVIQKNLSGSHEGEKTGVCVWGGYCNVSARE